MSKQLGSIPLTWTKLGNYNNEADIYLCDQIVAFRRFDAEHNEWNGSELQQWLNCDLYRQAFSEEQRKWIVSNETTQDCVFLLSAKEFKKYKQRIITTPCYWWLRSPGFSRIYASLVDYFCNICNHGEYAGYINGVRPAILLRKDVKNEIS